MTRLWYKDANNRCVWRKLECMSFHECPFSEVWFNCSTFYLPVWKLEKIDTFTEKRQTDFPLRMRMHRRELAVCLLVLAPDVCTTAVCSPRRCMCQSNKRKHNPFHYNKIAYLSQQWQNIICNLIVYCCSTQFVRKSCENHFLSLCVCAVTGNWRQVKLWTDNSSESNKVFFPRALLTWLSVSAKLISPTRIDYPLHLLTEYICIKNEIMYFVLWYHSDHQL